LKCPWRGEACRQKKEKQKKLAISTNIKSQTSKQGIELQKKN
jgi:hypothetical protein